MVDARPALAIRRHASFLQRWLDELGHVLLPKGQAFALGPLGKGHRRLGVERVAPLVEQRAARPPACRTLALRLQEGMQAVEEGNGGRHDGCIQQRHALLLLVCRAVLPSRRALPLPLCNGPRLHLIGEFGREVEADHGHQLIPSGRAVGTLDVGVGVAIDCKDTAVLYTG